MRYIVFDIETQNIFSDVGKRDPALLDIAVVAIYDSETDSYSSYDEGELPKLWPILEKADALIGYNCDHFDVPLLNKYYPGDLSKMRTIDLMTEIKKTFGRRIGLDAVCRTTIGSAKSANGLIATQWWKDGEYEKVREYCIQDVRVTKELFDYIVKNGHVKIEDTLAGTISEFLVDTSEWKLDEGNSLTHTLPF